MEDDSDREEEVPIPPEGHPAAINVSDLIIELNAAAAKMGSKNPNKLLIMNAAYAIRQLVDRLHAYEHPEGVM